MKPNKVKSNLASALEQLHDSDVEVREGALERISGWAKAGLGEQEVRELLIAAAADYPPAKVAYRSYSEELVQATWGHLGDVHVAVVVENYPRYPKAVRAAALAALARLQTAEATDAYVRLLVQHGWPESPFPVVTAPYEKQPRFPEKLLPPIADGSIAGMPPGVRWNFVLAYANASAVPATLQSALREAAIRDAQALVAQAGLLQRGGGSSWRWDDAYSEVRVGAGIVLDVLGHLGADARSVGLLESSQKVSDPELVLFAIVSLVRLNKLPTESAVRAVAADPETRNRLFDLLVALGRQDLFPRAELTQEKFAESNMVQWLTFPTELGRAPDRIEFMQAIERDLGPGRGVFVYYVFRFRCDPPHWSAESGWMAGVSGPFLRADVPTTQGWGGTFSEFKKWEEFSAEEHVASVEELIQSWREHQAEQ